MKISVVTSLYKSEPYIREFYTRISKVASENYSDYQIIFVNDGSPDGSADLVRSIIDQDAHVELIDLSRNFGQHPAMLAGLSEADGDYVFMIDADLEEPPELLEIFTKELKKSCSDFVFGVLKECQKSFFSDIGGRLFYDVFNLLSKFKMPRNIAMARLLNRKVVTALLKYPENQVFLGGLFEHIGFKRTIVEIDKSYKGQTTYNFRRKINLMIDAITSFSERPLRAIFVLGTIIWLTSCIYILNILVQKLFFNLQIGWASLFASIWFFGGLILMVLGIIGIYLSKIFLEIKRRPLTLIQEHYKRRTP